MRRLLPLAFLATACTQHFTPLQNRVAVGKEPYVVFAADGAGGQGDLFAASTSGGSAYQFTYSLADESRPALDPSGVMVAFVRTPNDTDHASRRVWVMNMLNGHEREIDTLAAGAIPERLAWSADGRTIFIAATTGLWAVPAPPADSAPRRLAGPDSAAADSALAVMVGAPPFARIAACHPGADDVCAFSGTGAPSLVDAPAREPFRWGADSLGYFVGERIVVRPVGPGRTRELQIERVPDRPRDASRFAGPRDTTSTR
ncbi:MAG TPA: hypothetical protein VFS28_01910 [Gemmatimonadales bacterium]|nr:hypothetical protein [Gemmatimonadales bacterium]